MELNYQPALVRKCNHDCDNFMDSQTGNEIEFVRNEWQTSAAM